MKNDHLRNLILVGLFCCASVSVVQAESKHKVQTIKEKIKSALSLDQKEDQQESQTEIVQKTAQQPTATGIPTHLSVSIADIVEPLLPAVVNVSAIQEESASRAMAMPDLPEGSPFSDLFKHFFEREFGPESRKSVSFGSGFVISPDGYIVTNYHVISESDKVMISFDASHPIFKDRFAHDNELEAEIVGVDPRTDIALLKVQEKNLPYVKFGNSDLVRVGDPVITIGNPFNLGGTVTMGIISSKSRDIGGRSRNIPADFIPHYFQTDAPINMGNSGGPMFNLKGEVVAVNRAILTPSGGSVGIGFSIPASIAQDVVRQLKEHGRTSRGWLGVQIQSVDGDIAQALGLKEPTGALVGEINPQGPAVNSGLKVADVILEFNGEKVTESRHLPRIVGKAKVGQKVPVVVWRDGKKVKLSVMVGEYEKAQDDGFIPSAQTKAKKNQGDMIEGLSIAIRPLNEKEKRDLETEVGLIVTEVDRNSEAFQKGLRVDHIIKSANTIELRTKAHLIDQINKVKQSLKKSGKEKGTLLLLVEYKNQRRFITLEIPSTEDRKK